MNGPAIVYPLLDSRGFQAGVSDSSGLPIRTLSLGERKGPRKVLVMVVWVIIRFSQVSFFSLN